MTEIERLKKELEKERRRRRKLERLLKGNHCTPEAHGEGPAANGDAGRNTAETALEGIDDAKWHSLERKLLLNKKRLELALDASRAGMWDWHVPTGETYFDDHYYTMLGYRPGEFRASYASWEERLHPDDREKSVREIREHIEERNESFGTEFRFLSKSGEWRYIWAQGRTVERDQNGNAIRVIGTHIDITDRKLIEREKDILFQTLQQRLKELNCLIGISDIIERWGQSLPELCREIAALMKISWQYPSCTEVEISIGGKTYGTAHSIQAVAKQRAELHIDGNIIGWIEVSYTGAMPPVDDSPFLKEERSLLHVIAERLSRIIRHLRIQEELRKSEERFHNLLRSLDEIVWAASENESEILYVNAAFERIYGYSTAELMSNPDLWFEAVHPDDREYVTQKSQELFTKSVSQLEYRIIRRDGSVRWILDKKNVIFNEGGNKSQIGGIATDITARKEAERKLRESEEKYRMLFENSHDAILVLTEEGIEDCNEQALHMFTMRGKEEMLALHPADISPPYQPDGIDSRHAAYERIQETIQKGRNQFEWLHRRKNGDVFPAEVLLTSYPLDDRITVQATVRDLTDTKRLERESAQRSNLEAVKNMMVTLNHEMNQPLSVITAHAQYLVKALEPSGEAFQDARMILEQAWRLAKLVKKARDIPQLRTIEYSPGSKMINLNDS